MKEVVSTEKGPKAIGPYSQAIKANGFIFTAGQIPFDPATGQLLDGDVAVQTARVLENLKAIVEAAGSSLAKAVKATVYLKDMNDFRRDERSLRALLPAESAGSLDRGSCETASRRARGDRSGLHRLSCREKQKPEVATREAASGFLSSPARSGWRLVFLSGG